MPILQTSEVRLKEVGSGPRSLSRNQAMSARHRSLWPPLYRVVRAPAGKPGPGGRGEQGKLWREPVREWIGNLGSVHWADLQERSGSLQRSPCRDGGLKGPSSEPRGTGSLATQVPRGPIMGKDTGDFEIERHGLCPQRASSLVLATDSWATFMDGFGWSLRYPKGHIGDSGNARNEGHAHCTDSCSLGPALPHGPTHPPLSQARSSAVSQHPALLELTSERGQTGTEQNETAC